jgi:hypothetical protein
MNIQGQHTAIRSFLPFLLLMVTWGCGGGGGSTSPPLAGPGVQSFVMRDVIRIGGNSGCPEPSVGRQNCITLRANARVTIDGRSADESEVGNGSQDYSVAFTQGTVSSSAPAGRFVSSVDIQHVVVGTIEAIDSAHQRFDVLGQRIYMTPTTAIDGAAGAVAVLAVGERVGVSGFFSSDGKVVATRVGHEDAGTDVVLRGVLKASPGGGFAIGPMALSLTNAVPTDFPNGAPADGDPVLVFGEVAGGVLAADSVPFIGGEWGMRDGVDSAVLVGMISSRPTASEMEVEGLSVDCSFFQCNTAAGIGSGLIASLDQVGGSGRVEVVAPPAGDTVVVGPVDAIDLQSDSLRVFGFEMALLPETGVSDAAGETAGIQDIRVGDVVSVSGAIVGDTVVAERITPDTQEPSVTTPHATFEDPEIHVGGQTITTGASTSVHDDCNQQQDLPWLFAAAEQSSIIQLRVETAIDGTGKLVASNVVADVDACPWDY